MTTTLTLILVTVLISILCFNSQQLFNSLSLKPYRVVEKGEWWRVISHGFVHGDTLHLMVNMFVLYSFGSLIERSFGALQVGGMVDNPRGAYLVLYFGGMIAATVHDLVKNRRNPYYTSIGASGAVSAVVFTTIFLDPWEKLYLFAVIPIPGILFAILFLGFSQCSARRGKDSVNHYAHLYGALFGFIFPILLNPRLIHHFLDAFRAFDV
jgi:membrane associated rhomboid family serine protease